MKHLAHGTDERRLCHGCGTIKPGTSSAISVDQYEVLGVPCPVYAIPLCTACTDMKKGEVCWECHNIKGEFPPTPPPPT